MSLSCIKFQHRKTARKLKISNWKHWNGKQLYFPVLKNIVLKRVIHSVHRLKKFTITRYWNILSLCGSGVLLSAPYPLLQPLMMKFSLICLPSVNRDISPPRVPMLLSLYKLPVNWDTMVMTSNRSSSISPSSPVKAICTVWCFPKSWKICLSTKL